MFRLPAQAKYLSDSDYAKLNPYQKVNHFPGLSLLLLLANHSSLFLSLCFSYSFHFFLFFFLWDRVTRAGPQGHAVAQHLQDEAQVRQGRAVVEAPQARGTQMASKASLLRTSVEGQGS